MRFVAHLLGLIAAALVVGFGLSFYAVTDGRAIGAFKSGPWSAWPAVGASAPDPYTRAYFARTGTLQLGTSEGIQFVATADSDGRALDAACRYRIDGTTPVAAFWTLVATTPEGVSIARAGTPIAIRSSRLARASDGSIIVYVSRGLAPRNWLEIDGDGPFELLLTLYDTSIITGVGAGATVLPSIIREACA